MFKELNSVIGICHFIKFMINWTAMMSILTWQILNISAQLIYSLENSSDLDQLESVVQDPFY